MPKTISAALLLVLTVAAGSASAEAFKVSITLHSGGTIATGTGTIASSSPFTTIDSYSFALSNTGHDFTIYTFDGSSATLGPPSGCNGASDAQELTFTDTLGDVVNICLVTALDQTGATVDGPNVQYQRFGR